MTTNNHPAHDPVSLDRLHQIREILSKASAQSDGGNLGYAMADAVKVIDGAIATTNIEPVACIDRANLDYLADGCDGHVWDTSYAEPGDVLLYTTPITPAVPDELTREEYRRRFMMEDNFNDTYRGGWNACRAAMLQAGNSPAIGIDLASEPDRSVEVRYLAPPGYVIVPIVPTEDMIINGFESVPDPHFSDEKEWEEYEALSGCRQAARRA
ncbi:hypothetical protein HV170_04355 [Citrobacter freundii]|uniref:hypothetical protein n=1 Tax=Citrobacter freundii TaxID=546 RepID=UPI0015F6B916|nr:hypothetical protein [Citrobacter freundii]